jgi:transcription termination factor Rho
MDLNELQSLHIKELTKLAQDLKIEGGVTGLNKQELIVKILEANAKKDGSFRQEVF